VLLKFYNYVILLIIFLLKIGIMFYVTFTLAINSIILRRIKYERNVFIFIHKDFIYSRMTDIISNVKIMYLILVCSLIRSR